MTHSKIKSILLNITPPAIVKGVRRMRNDSPPRIPDKMSSSGSIETSHGVFYCDTLASFRGLYKAYFQDEVYRFVVDSEKPFIIDGGANIGVGSRYFKHLHPQAEIIAFEPDDKIFSLLGKNMGHHSGFTARKMALWSSDGTLAFNAVGGEGGHLASVTEAQKLQSSPIEVETFRLRNLLDRKVDLLKLDIEGAELEVLRDCQDRLHNVERLFVEHHCFVGQMQRLGEFFGILEAAGFRVHIRIDASSPQPFMRRTLYNGKDSWLNIFAFRE